MTDERFAAIVKESDEQSKSQPAAYTRKMRLLVVLGDLYIAMVAVLLLTFQAVVLFGIAKELRATGWIRWQTALCLPALIWTIWLVRELVLLKGMRQPAVGIPLTPQQAPELFALIDAFCRAANAPPVRRVLIMDTFYAGMEQMPRLGLFGWHERKLLLGLPLLKCLTGEQFKVVLAHELGHMAKGCVRGIYPQMLRWIGLGDTLGDGLRGFLFAPFLKWFVPYVSACSFPLFRMSEYAADAVSVRLVSKEAAVETLSISNAIERYLEQHYWPQVRRMADRKPEPAEPYRMMGRALPADVDVAWVLRCTAVDMAAKTSLTETHPALQDRLAALQATPRVVLAEDGQNAEGLFGSTFQAVTAQMDREWQDKNRTWWVERYQRVQNDRRQFDELNARAAKGETLTVEEAYQRAQLTWSIRRNEDETFRQLLALYHRASQHALASFGLGAWLLSRYDADDEYDAEDGYALLEQAMRLDAQFTARCCEMLREYCLEQGYEERAQEWDAKLQARLQLHEAGKQEGAAGE